MKILFLVNARLPTEKAHGLQVIKTIEAFLQQGIECEMILPQRHNTITKSIREFYPVDDLPKIRVIKNSLAWLETKAKRIYFSLQPIVFQTQAFFIGLSSNADVLFSREVPLCFFLTLFTKKKVVFEDHQPKERFALLYKFFLRHIDYKIVVPQSLEKFYIDAGVSGKTFVCVPNGVDLKEFDEVTTDRSIWKTLGLDSQKKVILYTGHFYAWKGVFTLLRAAALLPQSQVVLIGGTHEDQKKVQSFVQEHSLSNVTLHSFVTHDQIIRYIKSADVVVLPNSAQQERSEKYTTPLKLFEYMASGVPIVASDIMSFRPYLKQGKNALFCTPDDPQALAQAVEKLLDDQAFGQKLGEQAQNEVKAYTWQTRVKKICSFLFS